jgi:hypothetical protein
MDFPVAGMPSRSPVCRALTTWRNATGDDVLDFGLDVGERVDEPGEDRDDSIGPIERADGQCVEGDVVREEVAGALPVVGIEHAIDELTSDGNPLLGRDCLKHLDSFRWMCDWSQATVRAPPQPSHPGIP